MTLDGQFWTKATLASELFGRLETLRAPPMYDEQSKLILAQATMLSRLTMLEVPYAAEAVSRAITHLRIVPAAVPVAVTPKPVMHALQKEVFVESWPEFVPQHLAHVRQRLGLALAGVSWDAAHARAFAELAAGFAELNLGVSAGRLHTQKAADFPNALATALAEQAPSAQWRAVDLSGLWISRAAVVAWGGALARTRLEAFTLHLDHGQDFAQTCAGSGKALGDTLVGAPPGSLRELTLRGDFVLTAEDGHALGKAIQRMPSLRSLTIAGRSKGDPAALAAFLEAAAGSQLTHLRVTNHAPPEHVAQLVSALPALESFGWNDDKSPIPVFNGGLLSNLLAALPGLRALDLRECGLGSDDVYALAKAIGMHGGLASLHLTRMRLDASATAALQDAIVASRR